MASRFSAWVMAPHKKGHDNHQGQQTVVLHHFILHKVDGFEHKPSTCGKADDQEGQYTAHSLQHTTHTDRISGGNTGNNRQ